MLSCWSPVHRPELATPPPSGSPRRAHGCWCTAATWTRTPTSPDEVGGRALIADLASPADRKRLADEAVNAFGRVDVLVNNAGFGHSGPFTAMSVDVVRRLIEVDLVAAIELTHALLPGMVERKRGAVCFVTSIAGRTGVAGEAVYSATKAGLDAFAESLRAETARSGVNISVVVPGVVDTGFFETRGSPYERTRPRPIPADAVADAVVRAVERDRAEVWGRGGCGSPRPCAHWLPARIDGLRSASAERRVTHRRRLNVVPRSGTRCESSRCPVTAASGPPDGSGGSTPARTGASRP